MDEILKELYERGRQLYEEGRYSEAEMMLKEVVKLKPDYADVLNKLGVMSSIKGEPEAAVDYFRRALKLNPGYTEASLNLAITLNELGKFDDAENVFLKASKFASPGVLDPFVAGKLANEHYKVGNLYLDFCLYDEAIEEYRKALKLRPHLPDVLMKLGIAQRNKGLYDDSISSFTKAKESNPGFGPAWVELGLTYYMKGHTGLAFEEWEAALKQNPNFREAKAFLKMLKKGD